MAESGAPREAPPPRPASRASSESGSPPRDDTDEVDDEPERAHRRRASTLDAHRDKSFEEEEIEDDEQQNEEDEMNETYETDDSPSVAMLHQKLNEFRVENDALGEATTALRRALRRATMETAESRQAALVAEKALLDEKEAAQIRVDKARADASDARRELEDVERLALELTDELEDVRAKFAAAKHAQRDAENAAAAAAEETSAARAMADSLRDALADAGKDAETKAAKAKAFRERAAKAAEKEKNEAVEKAKVAAAEEALSTSAAELEEARAAAARATSDRDAMASTWRKEWEAAKADHASELHATRARIASCEADLASARASLAEERDARAAAETAVENVTVHARRATRDRDGAVASLRALAEHEDTIREDTLPRAAVVGRLRDDATASAARCETLVARCAAACDERDAATLRAERAEADLAEMASLAETVAMVQTESARRRAERSASSSRSSAGQTRSSQSSPDDNNSSRSSPETNTVSHLLGAAVREGKRSPNSFARGMAGPSASSRPDLYTDPIDARQWTPASAPDPSTPETPETPDLRNEHNSASPRAPTGPSRWIHTVGADVAEELVHALAREVGELRDSVASLKDETASAKAARDDARRALLEETTRMRALERARVVDLRETKLAEQRAHAAKKTTWELRDLLALAAVDGIVGREGSISRVQDAGMISRDEDIEEDVDEEIDHDTEDAASEGEAVESKGGDYFRVAGARVFGKENAIAKDFQPVTPDLRRSGPRPRAAVPRATAFLPM